MIYDVVSSLYQYTSLIAHLPIAMEILATENLLEKAPGSYATSHAQVTYSILSYENSTMPRPYEVYAEKTSLHVLLSGKELLAFSWREHAMGLEMDEHGKALLEADPIGVIHAEKKHVAIFLPGEPYTYAMRTEDSSERVKKVVFILSDR